MKTLFDAQPVSNTARESALLKLTKRVQERTARRVKDIEVNLQGTNGDSTLILSGRTNVFYVKQLAQHGVMDLPGEVLQELDLLHQPKIENNIEVI